MMSWLRVDLRGDGHPIPLDCGSARARRIELRRLLLEEPSLTGHAALSLLQEMRLMELREAAEILQDLSQID
jgi:hypothetical protein